MIARFAQESGVPMNVVHVNPVSGEMQNGSIEVSPTSKPLITVGTLQNRTQALAQLRSVADFFRQTEPHSPVAYLADKAAHWGEMSLHSWLSTVIKDPGLLAHLEELLGLKLPPQTEA